MSPLAAWKAYLTLRQIDHYSNVLPKDASKEIIEKWGPNSEFGRGDGSGRPLLIVPAPIKRAYVWDLAPAVSVVRRLLEQYKHPEHGYRSCLGLLSLAKRYGNDRLEAACALALELGAYQYRHVRSVLETDRDRLAAAAPTEWTSPDHAHLRGPGYYQ